MKSLIIVFWLTSFFCFAEYYLDFNSGEYSRGDFPKSVDSLKDNLIINKNQSIIKSSNFETALNDFYLPEDKLSLTEWERELQKHPWKKWIVLNGEPITKDFVNTTSNTLVITILDYDAARRDNLKDQEIIKAKYRLYMLLHPGDKYVQTSDGHNGVRLAQYVQANDICENARKFYGEKYMDEPIPAIGGLTSRQIMDGINLTLSLDDGSSNIVAFCYNKDTDSDGIDDSDEINGKNGFVTNPDLSDTDNDGIPDKFDKNPLKKCRSNDSSLMPQEWTDYWFKKMVAKNNFNKAETDKLIKELSLVKGDPDKDDFDNETERMLGTSPIYPEKGHVFFFPKEPVLRKNKNSYELEFGFVIKTNIMTRVYLSASAHGWDRKKEKRPVLKYISSYPINEKLFPKKALFNESARDSWPNNLLITAQPMTFHKMKMYFKSDRWVKNFWFRIKCQDADRDKYSIPFATCNYEANNLFEKFRLSHPVPDPYLELPKNDQYFIDENEILCKWTTLKTNYWDGLKSELIIKKFPFVHAFSNVVIKDYKNLKFFKSLDGFDGSDIYFYSNKASIKADELKDLNEFETFILHAEFSIPPLYRKRSNFVPIFKTVRANENCSYVFKIDTLRNIRLQAKYGRKNFVKTPEKPKQ